LTGDVHWAQFFELKCSSYTGYNNIEVCSSGMTHVLSENIVEGVEYLMDGHTPKLYKGSEIYMEHNFATIEVQRTPDE
jgi:hypothetical protein